MFSGPEAFNDPDNIEIAYGVSEASGEEVAGRRRRSGVEREEVLSHMRRRRIGSEVEECMFVDVRELRREREDVNIEQELRRMGTRAGNRGNGDKVGQRRKDKFRLICCISEEPLIPWHTNLLRERVKCGHARA